MIFLSMTFLSSNYKLKQPQPLYRNKANSILILTNLLVPAGNITATSEISKNASGFCLHYSGSFLSHINIDMADWLIKPLIHFEESEKQNLIVLKKKWKF